MMSRIAPRNGMIVIDPATRKPLAAVGPDGLPGEERDITDAYWYRRLQDGDIEEVNSTEPQPLAAPVEAAKRSKKTRTDEGK